MAVAGLRAIRRRFEPLGGSALCHGTSGVSLAAICMRRVSDGDYTECPTIINPVRGQKGKRRPEREWREGMGSSIPGRTQAYQHATACSLANASELVGPTKCPSVPRTLPYRGPLLRSPRPFRETSRRAAPALFVLGQQCSRVRRTPLRANFAKVTCALSELFETFFFVSPRSLT